MQACRQAGSKLRRAFAERRATAMGPRPPTRLRMHRCMALAVEPSPGGDTSRTITAAGARQHSLQGSERRDRNARVAASEHAALPPHGCLVRTAKRCYQCSHSQHHPRPPT